MTRRTRGPARVVDAARAGARRTFASLRYRDFRLYFAAQVLSSVGTWTHLTALSWFMLTLTDSPLAIGILVVCRTLPNTLFGLVSGVLADRWDNRRQVMVMTAVIMLTVVGLAWLAFSDDPQPWQIDALAAAAATAGVFTIPARQSLVFRMVDRQAVPNAIALNATVTNAARAIGPAVAGALIATLGVGWCFVLNAATFVAVIAAVHAMHDEHGEQVVRGARPLLFRGIAEGIAYARADRITRIALTMMVFVGTLGFNFNVLVPVLASRTFHADAGVFGLLFSLFGLGAVVGSALQAAAEGPTLGRMLAACAGFSTALLVLAFAESVALAAGLLFAVGLSFTLWTANNQAIVQLAAPARLRGRVISLYTFASTGLTPLGSLFSARLAELGGTALAFAVAGGTGALMCSFAGTSLRHELRRERFRDRVDEVAVPES